MRKRLFFGFLAAAAVAFSMAGDAFAGSGEQLSGAPYEIVDAQVERDGAALLGPFVTSSARCRKTADSRAWIIERPRYGKAAVIKRRGEIAFDDTDPYAYCNDRPIAGTTVRYRPYKGFVGDDSFVFQIVFADGETRVKRVNVHVE